MPGLCVDQAIDDLVIAGTRLAWISGSQGNTEASASLATTRIGVKGRTTIATSSAYAPGGGTPESGMTIGALRGAGDTIVFTSDRWGPTETTHAWLLSERPASPCPTSSGGAKKLCRPLAAAQGGMTAAVDSGRVLTVAPGGIVRLLSKRGTLARLWTLGAGIVEARLNGRTLAVQHGAKLALYDTSTGAAKAMLSFTQAEGDTRLLDVQGGFAVYATQSSVHLLRLSDGRDRALALPRAAPPIDAQLTSAGLFVAWNRMYDARPGRVSFVPLSHL
jgi:hypothetical protein